jgi:hypothetical protein
MRRRLREGEATELARDLAELTQLSNENLNDHSRLRRSLLIRAIAYRLQEKGSGRPQARYAAAVGQSRRERHGTAARANGGRAQDQARKHALEGMAWGSAPPDGFGRWGTVRR